MRDKDEATKLIYEPRNEYKIAGSIARSSVGEFGAWYDELVNSLGHWIDTSVER